jgi:lipopolysaccharide transport system permease protein
MPPLASTTITSKILRVTSLSLPIFEDSQLVIFLEMAFACVGFANMQPMNGPFQHRIIAQDSLLKLDIQELWHSRDMLLFLVLRDFKIRFKQSYLGISWALLQPLCTTLVFTAIMGGVLKIEFNGPYPLFFLSGLIVWNYFSKVFGNGTLALVNEADLIRKVYFPRLILPLYQAISVLSDVMIALVIYFFLCLYYGYVPSLNIIWLPAFLFLAMIFGLTISLWLGPINVRFRDIQIVLPLITQLLFIASPVMYPAEKISESGSSIWTVLYSLNPMVGIIEGFRYCLVGQGQPFTWINLCSMLFVFCFFAGGLAFFNACQRKFADVI